MTSEPLTGAPDGDAGHVAPPAETAETAGAGAAPSVEERHRRSPTIRLKLTLWYGGLFLLAGVLLIAINFFMVRDSLTPAPEKARAAVAERFGIPPEALEFESMPGVLGHLPPGEMQRYVQINGIPLPRLLDEAQRELKAEALRQLWIRSLLACFGRYTPSPALPVDCRSRRSTNASASGGRATN
jgi:hypothetical protein